MSGLPPFLFNFLFVIRSTCSILLRIMLLSNLFVRLLLRLFFYMLLFYLIETLFILIICHCFWYDSLINTCLFNSLTVPWSNMITKQIILPPFSPSHQLAQAFKLPHSFFHAYDIDDAQFVFALDRISRVGETR